MVCDVENSEIAIDECQKLTREEIIKINNDFFTFLKMHKVEGDVMHTHTAFGEPYGKYFIDGLDYDKFLNLYKKVLEAGVINYSGLFMTEKQKEVGPMCIDFDFRFEERKRQYTDKNIYDITKIYMKLIKKYFKIVDKEELKAYITEKREPFYDEKPDNYKDGFHIMFNLPIDAKMRFVIHDEAKEIIRNKDILCDLPFTNTYDDVIDEATIIRNGWMMYGSRKKDKLPYILTKIYDENMKEVNKKTYSKDELVVLLSLRRYEEEDKLELIDNSDKMKKYIDDIYYKYNKSKKKEETQNIIKSEIPIIKKTKINTEMTEDEENIRKLLDNLKPERYEDYKYWYPICCVFKNENLNIELFHEFSAKSKKYNREEINKFISNLKNINSGYSIATLFYYIKEDNYEIFKELNNKRNDIYNFITLFNPIDIGKLYYNLNPDNYIYNGKSAIWYEYNNNNILVKTRGESPSLLFSVSEKIQNYLLEQRNLQPIPKDEEKKKKYDKLIRAITNAYNKMGSSSFSRNIIDFLKSLYRNDNIENLIDNNDNLLAFTNGVYDITIKDFRDIRPEDYIMKTTGYPIPKSNPENKKFVEKVLKDIFDNPDYYLKTTALSLFTNKFEKAYIHTGSSRNGKGVLSSALEKALGEYYATVETDFFSSIPQAGKPNPSLRALKSVRVLCCSEPEDNANTKINNSFFKKLTGRDKFTARALHENQIEFIPSCTIHMMCNDIPEFAKPEEAIKRRLNIMEYKYQFVENPTEENQKLVDTSIKSTLQQQDYINEFIMILLEYAAKYIHLNVIDPPEDVKKRTNKHFEDINIVMDWLNEKYIYEKNNNKKDYHKFKCSELRDKFIDFTNNNISLKLFNDYLKLGNCEFVEECRYKYLIHWKPKPVQRNPEEYLFD
jgi:P4 family phage/plasmid primase-like protien